MKRLHLEQDQPLCCCYAEWVLGPVIPLSISAGVLYPMRLVWANYQLELAVLRGGRCHVWLSGQDHRRGPRELGLPGASILAWHATCLVNARKMQAPLHADVPRALDLHLACPSGCVTCADRAQATATSIEDRPRPHGSSSCSRLIHRPVQCGHKGASGVRKIKF